MEPIAGVLSRVIESEERRTQELPDTRKWRPTSDVTVTLDVGDPSPRSLRFVRHRTPEGDRQPAYMAWIARSARHV